MAGVSNVFKLIPVTQEGVDPGELIVQTGIATYSTTATDVSVQTSLTNIVFGVAVPVDVTSIATDAEETTYFHVVQTTVSSGTFSIYRSSQGAISAGSVRYFVVGYMYDTN